jgi:hypothetical protein
MVHLLNWIFAYGKEEHHGQEHSAHFIVAKKEKDSEGALGPWIPLSTPSDLISSH